ncbi:hypothetical protein LPJ61_005459 [Coemansia biformis]|uniref:Thioesterase domain-containing protein n=1 Tax=Coemansia biformis TaxID=1286918 RepID=A0A9W7Y8S8_9FUNG|nr:hypothetical protein LPJ61_005459 [Coemansia biformis]
MPATDKAGRLPRSTGRGTMGTDDIEFIDRLNQCCDFIRQRQFYGREDRAHITWASAAAGELIAEILVTDEHIGAAGCIDEGWLGTMLDNLTAMLIQCTPNGYGNSVSTSISIQSVSPISPGTLVAIHACSSGMRARQPHATAIFSDKNCPERVYAVGTHTKFVKPDLALSAPRL